MDGMTVKTVGLREAIAGISGFSTRVRRKVIIVAVSKGASILRAQAARRAPEDSGTLKKNMAVKVMLSRDENRCRALIGGKRGVKVQVRVNADGGTKKLATFTKKKDGSIKVTGQKKLDKAVKAGATTAMRQPSRYLHLAEGGSRRHLVAVKKKKVLASAGRIFGRAVMVGAKPNPFLSGTVRSHGRIATIAAIARLKSGIEDERRKALSQANPQARLATRT